MHRPLLSGLLAGLPFNLVIVPFALLFGVVAQEAGLTLTQTMGMSALVIAGASQFIAVQMLAENAPALLAILTGLAVNLRMLMYSAAMAPHMRGLGQGRKLVMAYFLVDQTFGVSIRRFEDDPTVTAFAKSQFFLGSALAIVPAWYVASYIGAVAGGAIPPQLALDFAVPITFIALFAPSLRSLPHIAAALVATAMSLALVWVPFNGGVIVGGLAGMGAGAASDWALDWALERRKRHG